MTILTGPEIRALCFPIQQELSPLIIKYIDFDRQLQPAGFDVTIQKIETPKYRECGELFVSTKKLIPMDDVELPGELKTHIPYIFFTNEIFFMPDNVSAFVYPRSTLMRMGAQFVSAMVDAGYHGQLSFSVLLLNPLKTEVNTRFAQIIFHRHAQTFPYSGQYNNAGILKTTCHGGEKR